MTDTGQVPGEGLPENAGMVEQPGVPAHGAYTYLSETTAEDEDLLLLPGAQGAWGNEVAPPAPEPVVETVHEPGPHETAGRDSGAHDLSAVRTPGPAPTLPIPPITPRRPLHLGPPIPDTSASPVRSLADRGPAGAPARQPVPSTAEYLDVQQPLREMAPQGAAPWGAPAQAGTMAPPAETVVPLPEQGSEPTGAAQAAIDRLAPQEARHAEQTAGADGHASLPEEGAGSDAAVDDMAQTGDSTASAEDPQAATPVAAETGDTPVAAHLPDTEPLVAEAAAGVPEGAEPAPEAHEGEAVVLAPEGGEFPGTGVPGEAEPTDVAGQVAGPEAIGDAGEDAMGTAVPEAGQMPGAEGDVLPGAVNGVEHVQMPGVMPGAEAAPVPGAVDGVESLPSPDALPGAEAAQVPVAVDPAVAAAAPSALDPAAVVPGAVDAVAPAAPDAVEPAAELPVAVEAPDTAQAPEAAAVTVPDGAEAPVPTHATDAPQPPSAVPAPGEQPLPPNAVPVPGAEHPSPAEPLPTPEAYVAAEEPEAAEPHPTPAPETPATEVAEPQPVPVPAPESLDPQSAPQAVPLVAAPETAVTDTAPTPQAAGPDPAPTQQTAPPVALTVLAAEPAQAPEAVAEPAPEAVPEPAPAPEAAAPAPDPVPAPEAVQPPPGASEVTIPAPEILEVPSPESTDAEQPPQPADGVAAVAQPESPAAVAEQVEPQGGAPADAEAQAEPSALIDAVAGPAPMTAVPPAAQAPVPAPSLLAQPAGPQVLFVDQDQAQGQDHGLPVAEVPQPVGQFVPVEGSVPTTPHLAPTPPQALVLPAEEQPGVPAPRDGDPELVQHADDLDTRDADQEESTAAVEEARPSNGPAAPAYDDAEREAVLKVMRERRDIRNGFRSDPIPHEVLLRVLEAAHTAPSVGHSQPWDFVVIRSAETRAAMQDLAQRQREAYARSLPKGRAKQFKELKIEAILETPVNIVVTADPTRGGRHTLGRHTQPQMAPYSAALAVENLWLAARAEGLGVGWVSFFDEREMVRALGLPEHLEVIAYLCVGYVDEFPDEPELMQAGWSKRRPLSWVVHEETYGRRALPGEEPHDLLAETVSQIRPLDAKALGEAWERQKRMTKPAGALGMLEIISAQLSGLSRQCPPPIPEPAAVAIFAGDHGVHAQGVTPWPQEVTAQMVANFLGGGAVCNAFAGQVGAEVCVVDVGVAADLPATPGLLPRKVRAGTSDMTTGPAMTREEAKQAIEVGIETARDLVAAGNKALLTGEMGIANTTASAALISVFTDTDPAEVTGRGTGINDETLARKTEVVRRALEVHQPDPADPIGVLAAIGGFEHAAMVGLLLGGASLRTPVILDGVSAGAAALVARAIAPEVLAACIAGHRSAEPGHVAALNKLGLRPLVDLDLRLGEGTGALLALPLVQSTARAMHEVATFDSAGVTEK
ncbi:MULTISPECIES: nicotinate-nucleotide--dimethylbenzimidazole phosphoribosyltransferase [unclassified Streptomyces]|uniref:nicotinate-nucleotide--dimethylbenzimidazole phosphoribosyltransferase n=1 Tax=unclassified Streptomyces TaxID=2593676 RepID=UPI0036E7CBAD